MFTSSQLDLGTDWQPAEPVADKAADGDRTVCEPVALWSVRDTNRPKPSEMGSHPALDGRLADLEAENRRLRRQLDEYHRAQAEPYWDADHRGADADNTERKRMEQTLAADRNLLRAVIDNVPDFICAKDKTYRYILKNRAGAQLVGENDPEACLGKTDFDYFPTADAASLTADDRYVIETGQAILDKEEQVFDAATGRGFWILTTKVPFKDSRGNIVGVVGMGRDITRQKYIETALKESEQRFKDFAEAAADWFWETDLDLRVTYVSERYQALTGEAAERVLGRNYRDVYAWRLTDASQRKRFLAALYTHASFDQVEMDYWVGGEKRSFVLSGRAVFDASGRFMGYRGVGRDITQAKRFADQLNYHASYDSLTGLTNRRQFERSLEQALARTKTDGASHILCYIDLDQFKIVNDTVGHLAGDEMLKQVAGLLASRMRDCDVVARLGGDEFGLLLSHCTIERAKTIAERLIADFHEFRFVWDKRVFQVGASFGLVPVTAEATDIGELLAKADIACYTAKDLGRNRVHLHHQEDRELSKRRSELLQAAGIREVLAQNRFCLYVQPIVGLGAREAEPRHVEILLRMRNEDGTLLAPGAFIPAAERYGLMGEIDRWVIREVLTQFQRFFGGDPDILVSINLSGNSLNDASLLQFVQQQLRETRVAAHHICFEITETAAISNRSQATQFIAEMRKLGCRFALDDFGMGLSSFAYLKQFAVDYLKIDGSFIRDLANDPTDCAVVSAINQVGHVLGIKTIAEYVENEAILKILREIGVDLAQGYAIGKPAPLAPPSD